jgi:hypothetical protein
MPAVRGIIKRAEQNTDVPHEFPYASEMGGAYEAVL